MWLAMQAQVGDRLLVRAAAHIPSGGEVSTSYLGAEVCAGGAVG